MAGLWLSGIIVFGGLAVALIMLMLIHAKERGAGRFIDSDPYVDSWLFPLNLPMSILEFRKAGGWLFWGLIVTVGMTVLCVWGFREEVGRLRAAESETTMKNEPTMIQSFVITQ